LIVAVVQPRIELLGVKKLLHGRFCWANGTGGSGCMLWFTEMFEIYRAFHWKTNTCRGRVSHFVIRVCYGSAEFWPLKEVEELQAVWVPAEEE